LLRNFSLEQPFKTEIVNKFDTIVKDLLGIVIVSVIRKAWFEWLDKRLGINFHFDNTIEEYIFMTTLVFIIIHVFKKGIEIQEENELTV
jgi:hypothetical protein